MKKILSLITCIVFVFSLTSCKRITKVMESKKIINEAIEVLTEKWQDVYENSALDDDYKDKYVKIINTRIIYLEDDAEDKHEVFEDVDYIVEFELMTNYFNSSPYYENIGMNDCVIFKKNGEVEVGTNIIKKYRSVTFNFDLSDIIQSIEDLEGKYNQVLDIE